MKTPADRTAAQQALLAARAALRAGDAGKAAAEFANAEAFDADNLALLAEYVAFTESRKDWPAAARLYRRIGQLHPGSNFEAGLGYSLFRCEQYAAAIPLLRLAHSRARDDDGLRLALALALLKEFHWEEALQHAEHLLQKQHTEVLVELQVNCLYNLGRQHELDAILDDTLRDWPDSPLILALCGFHLLKSGNVTRGFEFLPAIRRRYELRKPDMKLASLGGWDGKRFDGMLLIAGEQGLGEEILCASMFPELIALGQEATISCDPRLIPLFSRSFPSLSFVSRYSDALDVLQDSGIRHYRFSALDLACLFRRQPFRNDQPWLVADPARVAELAAQYDRRGPGMRRYAISWRTVREVAGAPRSINLTDLAPLLRLPDVAWFNAQYGDYGGDVAALNAVGLPVPWDDLGIDQTQDIDGLAAQLCAFDALVSISNTTVHLAGALGVTAHLMLPKSRPVMWYWGYSGDSSPWYPSIRIHRNTREDDWTAFAESLAQRLNAGTW